MKILRYFFIFLILVLLAGSVTPVVAQSLSFQVPSQAVVVSINQDGSINIDYTITFLNDSSAAPIDIVDIGLPNWNYEVRNVAADVNGTPIKKITSGETGDPGISLYLQGNTIQPGATGTVHAYITNVKEVIYPATQTEAEDYGSLVFMPSYFGSQYCYGNTDFQMTIVLPKGITEQEGRYFKPENWPGVAEPESWVLEDGTIYYTWTSTSANPYTDYRFGASFPSRLLASGAVVQEPYVPPATNVTPSPSFDISSLCPVLFCVGFAGFFGLMIYSATVGAKKRKMKYLPPKISIEGNGIKRGLTAVEAAILMEQPMDKIMTMILFALLKKGAAEVVTKEPLSLKVSDPLPEGLYEYEKDFLAAYSGESAQKKKQLQTTMVNLIRSVTEKMKGFSRKESIQFYEEIIKRAWTQVENANTPEVKAQVYDENMDWTMLDKDYDDRTQHTFGGNVFIPAPNWWWRYEPSIPRPSTPTATMAGGPSIPPIGGSRPSVSMPSIPGSSFAASVVNSVSSFASGVMGGLTGFTSGVTNVTNPPPPPSTYRSSGGGFKGGGGGGHSCACACACAGCACACAGGGR